MTYILLATYNGQRFLPAMLQSLRAQSLPDWTLLVRDDGSSDGTLAILRDAASADRRVRILDDDRGNLGPAGNFGALCQAAFDDGARWAFLADQDDFWTPHKLGVQLRRLRTAEDRFGAHVPLLVHSDLRVVDETLRTLRPSLVAAQRFDPKGDLRTLLTHNVVTGCASAVNRALLQTALPIPPCSPMHDWWLALCAAATGRIEFLDEPLVWYRQHAQNRVGARGWLRKLSSSAKSPAEHWRQSRDNFHGGVHQTHELLGRLERRGGAGEPVLETLREYCGLFAPSHRGFRRLWGMRRLRLGGSGALSKASIYTRALTAAPLDADEKVRGDHPSHNPQPPDLDIGVIYTYEREFMPPLLSSLAASAPGLRTRLLLVDNDSEDGAEQWRGLFPTVEIIRNDRRLGYAPNLNRILQRSTAPYTLLLNTDMRFDPAEECLTRMVRFMDRRPDCGVAACRIYHGDGQYAWPARRFQTPLTLAARRFGFGRLLSASVRKYLYMDRNHREPFECDWLSGCFLLVRRQALEEVGLFDCSFAKYFEDVDFCLRMARAGWRVLFNGDTSCIHLEQRASKRLLSRDGMLHVGSYLRFLGKWGPAPRRQLRRAA